MSTRTHEVPVEAARGVGAGVGPAPAPRRGPGAVLVVLGAGLAALLVAGTALAVVALLVRQEGTSRAAHAGVGAVRVDASCPGGVSVVADPSMEPGAARVVWRERWSLQRPSHDSAVRGGDLRVGTTCSRVSAGVSAASDVSVRAAPDVAVAVDAGVGDVAVSGTRAAVRVSTGVGDVVVDGAVGSVAVDAGVGDVDVSGALVRASVDGGAGDVGVTSTVPPDLVAVGTGTGDVAVRLPADGQAYAVLTDAGTGDVVVGVPRDAGSGRAVRVHAGSGDVLVETAP